ncbi:MAG: hypothetical protein IJM81_04715 [Prevotella sp.]|nr:hypothetical protein [Prevotella sp.]
MRDSSPSGGGREGARQLVNLSTRQLVNSSTCQLINSSTRQLVDIVQYP